VSDSGFFSHYSRIKIARGAIAIVLFMNVQCAIQFLLFPTAYAVSFELAGYSRAIAIQGIAVLIFMWNIPYLFALINPLKNKSAYAQAGIMQFIGLLGETIIRLSISGDHDALNSSISRFIFFDTVGLVLLMVGFLLIPRLSNTYKA
jgi:hypothetical protein